MRAPPNPSWARHAYHQYTVRCADPSDLAEHLDAYGVDTARYYPTTIDQEPAYADVSASTGVAARASTEVLSVPVHPELTRSQVDTVATALAEYRPDPTTGPTTRE